MKKHPSKKRAARRRKASSLPCRPDVSYDTHLSCTTCGQHLYVPEDQLPVLLQGIARQGVAGLLCTCGVITLIDTSYFGEKERKTEA